MSLKSNTKTAVNTHELEIAIDAAAFETAVQAAYMKARKNISIDGFRKGKAPRKVIEKKFGETVFYEDAVNDMIPVELSKVIEDEKLDIVARPEIEVSSVDKENGVIFKAVCIIKPEVQISDYKGIEVSKTVKAVTEEDIEKQIDNVRQRNARLVTIEDRPAKTGDDVVIDFEGFVDGEAFEGGKAEKFSLSLGSGQFIPGFEDQIAGHSTDEEFEIQVTFPDAYQVENLAGKEATFKIKIHEIKEKELPDLDDEFVKDCTDFETLDAWKEDIKTKMSERNAKQADSEAENKLFDTVIEKMEAEVPQAMYDNRIDEMVQEFSHRLSHQGMNLEMYLQYTGMPLDGFKKSFEERAQKEVNLRLALEKIADLEDISVSEEELEEEYKSLAEANQTEVDKIKPYINEEGFKQDIRVKKASDLVKSTAKISE